MSKKAKKKGDVVPTKFSIKALNAEIDSIMKRLKDIPASPAKAALRRKMDAIQLMAYCGQDMGFDL